MVVVETARGVTTRVRFLPLILTSLSSKSGTPFYLNHRNRVNTILFEPSTTLCEAADFDPLKKTQMGFRREADSLEAGAHDIARELPALIIPISLRPWRRRGTRPRRGCGPRWRGGRAGARHGYLHIVHKHPC